MVAADVDDDDDGMEYEDDVNDVEGELADEEDEENECDDEDDDEERTDNGDNVEDEEDDNGDQLVKDFMGEMLQDVEEDEDRANGLLANDDDDDVDAIAVNMAEQASTVNRYTHDPALLLMDAVLSD